MDQTPDAELPASAVCIKRWPRMADFAQWGTACESAFVPPGTFLRAYSKNRSAARDGVLDADPVAARVRELMARCSTWSGSASELLRAGAAPAGAGADCGFGGRCHPQIAWAKLEALAQGAELAVKAGL